MAEFNFNLSHEDTQRLFAIKHLQDKDALTGNEFAGQLLEGELSRLFPAIPEKDENGDILNAAEYTGQR